MTTDKVMIALRDEEHVSDLVTLGCHLARGLNGKLMVLHVIEVTPALPLDAKDPALDEPARRILDAAYRTAEKNSFPLSSAQVIRGRHAGETIASEVREHQIDLLLIGHPHRHSVGEVLFGHTGRYVMRHVNCRLMVSVPARANP